ncbi:MAG TPA: LysR family transcriptional regulator [Ideonella sp.]|uniref:LysR family transcriptional regulator n=1 Tax=Ideonella sp. TaxID=1929293 RepID=UPI002E3334F6|nr:LysR family transcriptional regulator [Ideonella sp.]HEX5683860.1 LysR family transcriptional regulator [Ideonella sp.]
MNDPVVPAIELRSWRQFLALAETLHFGQAAQRLHMTQPPLTMAIQQLESKLGVPLFERNRRRVALSAAGEALVEPVRHLLLQAAALPGVAQAAGRGAVGRLRLGFVSTVGFGPLPGWLRGFRLAEPGVQVVLKEATTDVLLEALSRGEADAGFVLHAPGVSAALEPWSRLSVGCEPLVLALPEGTPLATARRLRVAELLAQPLVIFPRVIAPSLYDAVLGYYHRHGVSPVVAQEAIQMQTIVNLVSAGLGLAWVPRSMTQLQRPGVAYRALPAGLGEGAPQCETSLVWSPGSGAVAGRFAAFVAGSLDSAVPRRS